MAGARAAIIAGLLLSTCKNIVVTTPWTLLPFVAIWTTYAILRRRSLAEARMASEGLAV
jgi:hypothetical protein